MTSEEGTYLNDDGEREVRNPDLVESTEIDPEIYLQLTSNQRKRLEETPSKQQKELIDSFLEQNKYLPKIRNNTQKKRNLIGLPSFGQILVGLIFIGCFVVLWQVGFINWGADRINQFFNWFDAWLGRKL